MMPSPGEAGRDHSSGGTERGEGRGRARESGAHDLYGWIEARQWSDNVRGSLEK